MESEYINNIGGDFEINPLILDKYPNFETDKSKLLISSGRGALKAILLHISKRDKNIIHIPYYICKSVVTACLEVNYHIKFYELDDNFQMPLDYTSKIGQHEVVLTVNYFGFVNDNSSIIEIKNIRPDIIVISDQVQSYWTTDNSIANYSFTSLRKHFAIPDGAIIFSNVETITFKNLTQKSSFYKSKLLGSLLKYYKLPDEVYLKFFQEGETELDNDDTLSLASDLSHFIFETLDFERIMAKRKNNYKLIYEIGNKYDLQFVFPYNEKIIPLNVPILVNNRDKIRTNLKQNNIFLPVHWPIADYNKSSNFVKKMATKELSLVNDQRYSNSEIEFEMNKLIKIIKNE